MAASPSRQPGRVPSPARAVFRLRPTAHVAQFGYAQRPRETGASSRGAIFAQGYLSTRHAPPSRSTCDEETRGARSLCAGSAFDPRSSAAARSAIIAFRVGERHAREFCKRQAPLGQPTGESTPNAFVGFLCPLAILSRRFPLPKGFPCGCDRGGGLRRRVIRGWGGGGRRVAG